MHLKKIYVKHFGCLDDFMAEFLPGLNIIRGPNESGKSTLHQALLMTLMSQPTRTQKTTPWRRWGSDQWFQFQLDLVDDDRGVYQITKDFESQSQSVTMPGGVIAKGRDKVDKVLDDTVGTTSMVIMQSTLCVEQDAMAEITNGRTEISQGLETVLTGSQDHLHTGSTLKRLDSYIKDFKKGYSRSANQPGPLASARDAVDQWERRVKEIQRQISALSNDEQELTNVESRLKMIEQELLPLQKTKEQVERLQKGQSNFHQWQDQEGALERKIEDIHSAQKELHKTNLELSSMAALSSISGDDKRAIDQLSGRVETLREEYVRYADGIRDYEAEMASYRERQATYDKARADYESELEVYNCEQQEYEEQLTVYHEAQQEYERLSREYEQWSVDHQQRGQGQSSLWIILLVVGVLAAASGLTLSYLGYSSVLGIIGPVAGLLLVIAGVWLRIRSAGSEQVPPGREVSVPSPEWLERPLSPSNKLPQRPTRVRPEPPVSMVAPPIKPNYDERALKAAEDQLQQSLTARDCQTMGELNDRYEIVVGLRQVTESTRARLDTLLNTETLEELEQQRRKASRQRRDAEEILQDAALQRVGAMSAIEINELESRIEELESERGELLVTRQRLSIKLEQQYVSKEELFQAEETLESAKNDYSQAKERLAVLELTNDILGKARERTLTQAQEQLGPATGKYLRLLTNDRYETVWIDPNLNIHLQHPSQPERRINPENLSRGARDQLYMAARLALVDMLFPNTRPPILLDDPFVHFDPDRLAAAIKMCCDIAEERQVLLFTCSDRYNHVGHHILMPTAR